MARSKIKTEMKGTGGGRWTLRAIAKADIWISIYPATIKGMKSKFSDRPG